MAFWNRRQAVPGQAAPIFEDDNMDAMGESELEHFVEQLERNVLQNQALYGYLEVVAATDARKWQAGQTKRLMENIEGLKVQQILIERRMLEVEDILDELRMEEQAVEQHRREQMELKQEMTRQQLGQQMEQSRVRSTKTTNN